jgi:uncharacterized damage-inducible protein DinB
MTETQREPTPRVDTGELDTALAFLRFQRHCLIKKLDGLDEEQARRAVVPTGTSLVGLIQHCTVGERYWFRHHLLGEDPDADWDFSMQVPAERGIADVVADFERASAASDAAIAQVGDPDALTVLPVDGAPKSLRWVLSHVITEKARHAGHADIIRELIDGTTGR